MSKRPATVRVARWSATHPWRAMGMWVAFVALCVVVGGGSGKQEATDEDLGVGESGRAIEMVNDAGLADPATENVVITAAAGELDHDAAMAAANEAGARMAELADVSEVGEPVTAENGSAILLPITMGGDPDTASDRVEPLLAETEAVQESFPDLRVEQVGDASIDHGIWEAVGEDLATAEMLSLPITLLIMLVAFGAIIAAGVPVLLALSAVAAAIGLSTLSSHVFPDAGSTANVILLMGMAVGVDYSLFYLKRDREERARGRDNIDAIEVAAATSGHSVVVSGLAVIVSMTGLYLTGYPVFSSLATAAIIVVAVAMLGSLTVLPALLAKLGRAVDRPRVPLLWRVTRRPGGGRLWPALLRPALRHPVSTLLVAVAAMGALAIPAMDLKLQPSGEDTLPRSIPVIQAYDRMTEAFPSKSVSHEIVVSASAGQADEVTEGLEELADRTQSDPLFAHDKPPTVTASGDERVHVLEVATPYGVGSDRAEESLDRLRDAYAPEALGGIDGVEYAVGGTVASGVDETEKLSDNLPLVVGFVLLLTFLMMAVVFRSVVIAGVTMLLNLLSAAAAFGVLVLVFQHTWAEGLLDFQSSGGIVNWVPLFIFAILFGLSMDYHVFVLGRIREVALAGRSTREAVAQGITSSAGVVTSAAIVMVSVFSVFAAMSLIEMKAMGIGLAVAVLLDATLVRAVILPAAMVLLGRANWWPSRLSRRAIPERPVYRPEPAGQPVP